MGHDDRQYPPVLYHQQYTPQEIKASSDKKLYIITDNNQDRNVKTSKIDLDGNVIWSYNDTTWECNLPRFLETNDRILLVAAPTRVELKTLPCIFELDKNGWSPKKLSPILSQVSQATSQNHTQPRDGNIICTSVKTTDVKKNIHTIFISKFRPDLSLIWNKISIEYWQIPNQTPLEAGDGGFLISLDLYIPSSVVRHLSMLMPACSKSIKMVYSSIWKSH